MTKNDGQKCWSLVKQLKAPSSSIDYQKQFPFCHDVVHNVITPTVNKLTEKSRPSPHLRFWYDFLKITENAENCVSTKNLGFSVIIFGKRTPGRQGEQVKKMRGATCPRGCESHSQTGEFHETCRKKAAKYIYRICV